jgi:phage/plasmid primase-like uncharacterized protein
LYYVDGAKGGKSLHCWKLLKKERKKKKKIGKKKVSPKDWKVAEGCWWGKMLLKHYKKKKEEKKKEKRRRSKERKEKQKEKLLKVAKSRWMWRRLLNETLWRGRIKAEEQRARVQIAWRT